MMHIVKRKPIKCPVCGEKSVLRIQYGFPTRPDTKINMNAEPVILGGCLREHNAPSWQCTECNTFFHKDKLDVSS